MRRHAAALMVLFVAACTAFPACASDIVLRVGFGPGEISTLDPHRASAMADKALVSWMFNGLVRFRPGGADPADMEADLAERWERSADGLVWTFHLRPGVRFHGEWGTVTADDVVYSLRRAADARRSAFSSDFAGVESVEALDEATVRIVLKYPDAHFLGRVSNYHGGHIVSRKASEQSGEAFGAQPVGAGPFAFVERRTQQYVRLAAHPAYFRGAPKIGAIEVRAIAFDSARELALASGEVDLIYGKREQRWVEAARRRPGVHVEIFGPGEFRSLHLNRRVPPLDDIRVRRALAAAIDVDELVRYVGEDVAAKGCSIVPPGYLGEDCSARYVFDPASAKALLAEAGLKGGFTLNAVVSNIQAQRPIMTIIQAQLARIGVRLEMQIVDHAAYQSRIRKDLSALVFYGAARFPVADAYLSAFFHSSAEVGGPNAGTNFSHCAAADAQIEAARAAPDEATQRALWKEAQRLIMEDVCAIPLFDLRQVWARSDRLEFGYALKGAMNLAPPITEATTLTTP